MQKSIAKKVELRGDTAFVVVENDGHNCGALITIHGINRSSIADGIVRMINEDQCSVCGRFNGLHGEVFVQTGQHGGGEVEGHYSMCPNGSQQ